MSTQSDNSQTRRQFTLRRLFLIVTAASVTMALGVLTWNLGTTTAAIACAAALAMTAGLALNRYRLSFVVVSCLTFLSFVTTLTSEYQLPYAPAVFAIRVTDLEGNPLEGVAIGEIIHRNTRRNLRGVRANPRETFGVTDATGTSTCKLAFRGGGAWKHWRFLWLLPVTSSSHPRWVVFVQDGTIVHDLSYPDFFADARWISDDAARVEMNFSIPSR